MMRVSTHHPLPCKTLPGSRGEHITNITLIRRIPMRGDTHRGVLINGHLPRQQAPEGPDISSSN